ncbi:energy transducer TonB [Flavobacterium sp.]|uniref:energy transducer TonB n=1 Tax=Flavobacterium sp. TaxID=239 RepID=UPI003750F87F
MKSIALVLFFMLFSSVSFAQIGGEDEVYLNGDRIEAKFNGGGLDKFYDFINKEFDFSKVTKAGKMITSFTIDVDGTIKNIKVIQFVDVQTATEIIRVLKKAPKWEPAKRGGKPISVEIKLPLDFKVSNK